MQYKHSKGSVGMAGVRALAVPRITGRPSSIEIPKVKYIRKDSTDG